MKTLLAACALICITEISPHKIGDQEEWFEIYTEQEDVIIQNWKISNGKSVKKFETIQKGTQENYFYFQPSPLSLPNDGGTIQILDESDQIIDEIIYPKTKSGTKNKIPYAEFWNRDQNNKLTPLLLHTQGRQNDALPTHHEDLQIFISEASPKHEKNDFLELFIASSHSDKINLKNMQIKHNGSLIQSWSHDFWVQEEDFIKIENLKLSSGSGTIEVILNTGTSQETHEDFICWKNKTLSKTEQTRVDKFIKNNLWSGPCFEIQEINTNESIARTEPQRDQDQSDDFFRHFHGSLGQPNTDSNGPPQAIITIQRSGRTQGGIPFSFNPTGENSTDPDGPHDIKHFRWYQDHQLFSENKNPSSISFQTAGKFIIRLEVEDFSGEISTTEVVLKTTTPGSAPSGSFGQNSLKKEVQKKLATHKKAPSQEDPFTKIINTSLPKSPQDLYPPIALKTRPWTSAIQRTSKKYRDRFSDQEKKYLTKNLGRVFLE